MIPFYQTEWHCGYSHKKSAFPDLISSSFAMTRVPQWKHKTFGFPFLVCALIGAEANRPRPTDSPRVDKRIERLGWFWNWSWRVVLAVWIAKPSDSWWDTASYLQIMNKQSKDSKFKVLADEFENYKLEQRGKRQTCLIGHQYPSDCGSMVGYTCHGNTHISLLT